MFDKFINCLANHNDPKKEESFDDESNLLDNYNSDTTIECMRPANFRMKYNYNKRHSWRTRYSKGTNGDKGAKGD